MDTKEVSEAPRGPDSMMSGRGNLLRPDLPGSRDYAGQVSAEPSDLSGVALAKTEAKNASLTSIAAAVKEDHPRDQPQDFPAKKGNVELNFGPAWARQSADKWVLHETNPSRHAKPGREWKKDSDKGPTGKRFGNRTGERPEAARKDRPRSSERIFRRPARAEPAPNIAVAFIPERSGLKPLVKQLASTRRAYSLFEIAATFLSKPEFYAAALESTANDGTPAAPLYQCVECKAVFTSRPLALAHGLNRHLELFYDKEEKECEPPQGSFLCIARCSLSGELLGPPNYHGFNERLQELHRARFADMPLDLYRKKITNESDPALIEQWKKAAARKKTYRTKLLNEQVVFESAAQLEKHFSENYAAALIREGYRFVIPATAGRNLDDQQISRLIQEIRNKELRFPINMAKAIQKRFRRLGLHIFKMAARTTFVSAVRPRAIDPAQATETVRNILEWIRKNPRKTRPDLVKSLVPGRPPESPDVAGIINSLVWLIDRGHVIEFMNATLAVPNRASLSAGEADKPG